MRRLASVCIAAFCALSASHAAAQNVPPSAPEITEPRDGRIINPADLHMETGPFADSNPGDTHACTDWEVWTVSPSQRVWATLCIGGIEKLHTHLGDGVFEGSHAGRRTLLPDTAFTLRVRHKDSSTDLPTQWSAWSQRAFVTGAASAQFPMELEDVLALPTPQLTESTGTNYTLAQGVKVRLVTASGQLLLEFMGRVGIGNLLTNPAALAAHEAVKVEITAGTSAVSLPDLDLAITEHVGERTQIYLPATALAANGSASFWVAANGGTYRATPGSTVPEFATLARGPAVAWTTAPEFRAEIVATGFQLPVSIAFVPNPAPQADAPLYYVAELYGQIKVVARNGVVSEFASGLLNFNPTGNFPGSGEQGLACIAVSPINGDLFITVMYAEVAGNEASPHHPAVERLTSTDGGRTMATRTRILNMAPEVQGQSHQISNITFGPDGYL
ncbi:MAG: PQQ-dependent sugar dehydrogenase, partial [Planctomycetota bacterium]|nr:PQQ-dependent sugar dehydrogenase [Planctomycetota bacterium]